MRPDIDDDEDDDPVLRATRMVAVQSPGRGFQTVKQRWRFRRDLVIAIAHQAGMSQRMLADVFDLPRSRIYAILQRFSARSEMPPALPTIPARPRLPTIPRRPLSHSEPC